MIKLNFAQIRNPAFNPALTKIMTQPLTLPDAKRVVEIVEQIRKAQAQSDEGWMDILKEHFQEDTWATAPKLLVGADAKEAEEEIKSFLSTEVKIDTPALTGDFLNKMEITPLEIIMLKGLIE